ncbi:hypothetical protein [Mangrovimonas futianensis]|uniref:hypothetical protein n=1 Tax=Mangrovimonas futianensis TaxID=2895523 RepID=UPI001E5DC601|nr:hypothetical protein [Mangrovimonas futianensis]MCF1422473.1 hypothetical protein [Mangrovimonas futianensis]
MKKYPFIITALALITMGCKRTQDPFEIDKGHIGLLTDSTQVKDIKSLFSNDSVVILTGRDAMMNPNKGIEIFDKEGKSLLELTAKSKNDSTSTISTVKVIDPRFKTPKGINVNSTFGDLEKNYKISKIETTWRNVVVFVNEFDGFFTIEKSELPGELQFDQNAKIEAIQIPDQAKIKYFMIGW